MCKLGKHLRSEESNVYVIIIQIYPALLTAMAQGEAAIARSRRNEDMAHLRTPLPCILASARRCLCLCSGSYLDLEQIALSSLAHIASEL